MKMNISASTRHQTLIVEQCWVLTGAQDGVRTWRFRRRHRSTGQIASVEAAWEWALRREERFGDVLGFFHTHPRGFGAKPSAIDIHTMMSWCISLGKPLLCVIAAGKTLNGYIFVHFDGLPEQVESIHKKEHGWYVVKA